MPNLSSDQIRELSRTEPQWEPGCTLRLEHPNGRLLREEGSLHTLRHIYSDSDGHWMVGLEGSPAEFYSGRFSLASPGKLRYKTNHKIGVPKGKLP